MEIKEEKHKKEKKYLYKFISFFLITLIASWILPSILNIQERQVERIALIFFAIFLIIFLIELRKKS